MRNSKKKCTNTTHNIHERQSSHGQEYTQAQNIAVVFFSFEKQQKKNWIEIHHCVYFHIYTLYIVVRLNTYANAEHDRKTDSNYKRFVWFDMRSSIVWVLDNARLFASVRISTEWNTALWPIFHWQSTFAGVVCSKCGTFIHTYMYACTHSRGS